MAYFLFHRQNAIAQKLQEANEGVEGFVYRARQEMEQILRHLMQVAEIDIDPRLYMHIGSLAGPIDKHLPLDPNNELHAQILKVCRNKNPWSFVKLDNGPKLKCVIGYCNSDPSQPFLMTSAQMAQKGLINTSFVPS